MTSITEISGYYVSSSAPRALLLPLPLRNQNIRKDSQVLYAPASSKKHTNIQQAATNSGDSEVPPVDGRQHIPIQTDLYLEELCDKVEETDEGCQTDLFLDRPASPLFVPAKIGVDVATQIWTGDLFDFDKEVQPLVESLVSQTIEQSLIEIVSNREEVELKEQQREFESRRKAELAECIRLQEKEKRLLDERRKRLHEQETAVQLEKETTEKIAACVYAQNYLSDLLPKVYKRLEAQGYFATQVPEFQEVEEDFWPWFINEVDSEINNLEASCCLLDSLIEDAVQDVTETAVIHPVTPDVYPGKTEEALEISDDTEENVLDEQEEEEVS